MYTGILHTHTLLVTLFLLIYLVKTILLASNRTNTLSSFNQKTEFPERLISVLFLISGLYLWMNSGDIGMWIWVKMIVIVAAIVLAVVAQKNLKVIPAVFSVLLLVYVYGISETKSAVFKAKKPPIITLGMEPHESGKLVFETYCTSCHGKDGKSGLSGAKDLTLSLTSADNMKKVITHGVKTMPSFGNILTQEQTEAVILHIHTLQR